MLLSMLPANCMRHPVTPVSLHLTLQRASLILVVFWPRALQSHVKVHSFVQARVSASYPKNNQGRGGR